MSESLICQRRNIWPLTCSYFLVPRKPETWWSLWQWYIFVKILKYDKSGFLFRRSGICLQFKSIFLYSYFGKTNLVNWLKVIKKILENSFNMCTKSFYKSVFSIKAFDAKFCYLSSAFNSFASKVFLIHLAQKLLKTS